MGSRVGSNIVKTREKVRNGVKVRASVVAAKTIAKYLHWKSLFDKIGPQMLCIRLKTDKGVSWQDIHTASASRLDCWPWSVPWWRVVQHCLLRVVCHGLTGPFLSATTRRFATAKSVSFVHSLWPKWTSRGVRIRHVDSSSHLYYIRFARGSRRHFADFVIRRDSAARRGCVAWRGARS